MTTERRRAPRWRHDSVVEILDASGGLVRNFGKLVDVSKTGACFASTALLEYGGRFTVRVRLMSEGVRELPARVVWTRTKNNVMLYGIEFEPAGGQGRKSRLETRPQEK